MASKPLDLRPLNFLQEMCNYQMPKERVIAQLDTGKDIGQLAGCFNVPEWLMVARLVQLGYEPMELFGIS